MQNQTHKECVVKVENIDESHRSAHRKTRMEPIVRSPDFYLQIEHIFINAGEKSTIQIGPPFIQQIGKQEKIN